MEYEDLHWNVFIKSFLQFSRCVDMDCLWIPNVNNVHKNNLGKAAPIIVSGKRGVIREAVKIEKK